MTPDRPKIRHARQGLAHAIVLRIPKDGREKRRMAQDHEHDDDGHHHGSELSEMQLRVRALETVLAQKGYIDPAALDLMIEAYETKIGPHNGARVIAKAWSNETFRQALLTDATKAVRTLGLVNPGGDHLSAVENTPALHNISVCTLCS